MLQFTGNKLGMYLMCGLFRYCFGSGRRDRGLTGRAQERRPLLLEQPVEDYGSSRIACENQESYILQEGRSFISYMHKSVNNVCAGWKLHLSIESDEEKITLAWGKVVVPVLMRHNLSEFKVAKIDKLEVARGRVITIYLARNPELQVGGGERLLEKIIQDIEATLRAYNIRGGEEPPIDEAINGSQYFYFRNDRGPKEDEGIYVPLTEEQVEEEARKRGNPLSNPLGDPDSYGLRNIAIIAAEPGLVEETEFVGAAAAPS